MFTEIDTLPCTQMQSSRGDRENEAGTEEAGFHMSRHIIRTLHGVFERQRIRDSLLKIEIKISANGRIRVFIDREGGGGVLEEEVADTDTKEGQFMEGVFNFGLNEVEAAVSGF